MAERAERARHYTIQAERASADEAVQARRSTGYSRLRLALFLAALALLLVGTLGRTSMSWPLLTAALAGFAAFAVVVGIHARVEEARARAVARRECAEISLARMARNWTAVPAVHVEADDVPLAAARAADLDVDGASSL